MNLYFAALLDSLSALLPFTLQFFPALILVLLLMKLYTMFTPHNEGQLIGDNNLAAATSYGGTLIGFGLPVASALIDSVSFIDAMVWVVVAGLVQLGTFIIFRMFHSSISDDINNGKIAPALKLAAVSVLVGMLNAASMTY
ncbi:DUF350 domain-containing protein [Thalassospira xianhensis]|uniref:DUF350 domain-containing protein n=1 Tax=Thalassospira xianhensis MCCC 1A02616 TaxID=1177929 RepID=A0A367UHJ2_9PROT|nr:DUF350 domain-containing protein [Thalassospira xianhensis]RCK07785.1 hypothetical protein TH5_01705 [Thalassospira xianhensis MCCC 1A02616]